MAQSKTPRPNAPNRTVENWFRSSDDVRSGFASGNTFTLKPVRYSIIGGMAIFEGDIALGTAEQMARAADGVADSQVIRAHGVAISGDRFRWPGAVIPYVIDAGLSNPQRVPTAMAEWSARTPLRFVERQPGNPAHENYVSFEELDGCWSEVGMRGGKQTVSLAPSCGHGSSLHEIGHVAGLWHEQSREDRDQFVRVLWENVIEGREHNFDQHIADGDDIGEYDYGSIMHYPALAFSKNGQPTIVPRAGATIGQRIALSDWDVAAVVAMYSDISQPPIPPAPQRGDMRSVRLGSVGAYEVKRWATDDWPVDWAVNWSVVPSSDGARVDWRIEVQRLSGNTLRYVIEVRNLGSAETAVDARYAIF